MSLHGPGIQNSRFHGPLSPLVKQSLALSLLLHLGPAGSLAQALLPHLLQLHTRRTLASSHTPSSAGPGSRSFRCGLYPPDPAQQPAAAVLGIESPVLQSCCDHPGPFGYMVSLSCKWVKNHQTGKKASSVSFTRKTGQPETELWK